jgi:hypothetical protein
MVLGNIYSEKVTDDMPWSCEITNGWTDGLASVSTRGMRSFEQLQGQFYPNYQDRLNIYHPERL